MSHFGLFGNSLDFPNVSEQLGMEFTDLSEDGRENFLSLLEHLTPRVTSQDLSVVACGCSGPKDFSSVAIKETLDVSKHGIGIALFDVKKPCSMDELQKLANEKIEEIIARESQLDIGEFAIELMEKTLQDVKNLREIAVDNNENLVSGVNNYYIPRNQRINLPNKYSHKNFRHHRKILRK